MGVGNTSTVFMCQSIHNSKNKIVLKLLKKEYIQESNENMRSLLREVSILSNCNHKNIIKFIDYGTSGTIQYLDGHIESGLVFITMEYFSCETLYDYVEKQGDSLSE